MNSNQRALDALSRLEDYRSSFMFSLGAYALMTEEPTCSLISNYSIKANNSGLLVESKDIEYSPTRETGYAVEFGERIPRSAALSVVRTSFYSMLADSYETCVSTFPQDVKNQDWYEFARHLRNAVSHDGRWNFKNKNIQPVKWRSLIIDHSMHGHTIDGFIGWFDGLQLGAVMHLFVQDMANKSGTLSP